MKFYTFDKSGQGSYKIQIDISKLFGSDLVALNRFENKWDEFIKSDINNFKVISREKNIISYFHKSWIPEKTDNRKNVALIFGNPAPHSVLHDIYFSYEGDYREHRFWKVIREVGLINMNSDELDIKQKFFNLEYNSPFRLALEVIHTFPSSSSDKKWSGVAGIEKLFGKKAIMSIEEAEKDRLNEFLSDFFEGGDKNLVIFQKNAYNAIASNSYNLKMASEGRLLCKTENKIIFGVPPTRWLYTNKMKNLLKAIVTKLAI